jgi:alpha-1,6-mannosyltransferase
MTRPYPQRLSLILSTLPFLITFTHVLVSPYTKVEESFTLHAVHDVLGHGTDYKKWDYVQFPGAVPRSFLPSILIAAANWPWVKAATAMGVVKTKLGVQVMSTWL